MPMTGQCLCGQFSYSVDAEPQMTAICHCKNCQRQAGSAFSILISVPADAVTTRGDLKTYHDKGESGAGVDRKFCAECGSPVFTHIPAMPGATFIKAGTLDVTSGLKPSVELWCQSAQPWVPENEGAMRFDTNPPSG
jgi:hypothetical protein